MFRNYKFKNFNIRLVFYIVALTLIGIAVIGSANEDYLNRQILGLILGLIVMIGVSFIDYSFVLQFSNLIYALIVVILGAVLVLGDSSKGATRWIDLGFIRFQPSELAKVLLVLFFANYLMRHEEDLNTLRILVLTAVLAAIPLLLIVKEPDLSTTIVTFCILFSMLFVGGLDKKYVITVVLILVIAVSVVLLACIIFKDSLKDNYQLLRILAWLYPDEYTASSYQQQNSIMAIGSGNFLGKGLYNTNYDSVKNGNYISEPQTDFIFAVAGEELGFVGCLLILLLLFLISFECIRMSRKARDMAGRIICIGMGALVGFQSFVNICVVTGLFPNTGLPLPFVSYGLTSLVTLYFGMGFVLNIGLQTKRQSAQKGGLL